jgi:hypothetical protein
MSVNKFTHKKEVYDRICAFLTEYELKPRVLVSKQLTELHILSTEAGRPSKPTGCGSCNRIALDVLYAYKRTYENPEE